MNKELTKKILIYAGIVLFFIVLSYGFVPQVLGGKIVNQSDIASWKGMANEAMTYNAAHPEDPTAWTNSMFGGMPTTAMIDDFEGDWTQKIYKFLLLGRRPATYLFLTLLGAFLLMMSMGINGILAVAGAIAVAFCSYNMQIIQVGHNTKMQAIAYFPWVLAAMIFTYKSALRDLTRNGTKGNGDEDGRKGHSWKEWLPKTVLGTVLFALALSMQIKANHVQITYYLAIVIFVYAISLFISLCMDKDRKEKSVRFFAASGLLLVVGIIGIATNANKLIPTYEYTPYTMRGGSELSASSDTHNAKGLDLAYATAWSYGIEEMPNLLIPNFNGGSSSGPLDTDSETGKLLKRAGQPRLKETLKHMPLYWGPQPFTAGPMYMGAISIFLFVLGICLIKGREKWWIVIATLIAVLLSWGNHFMWFTRLWFDYAPFYNKFRTVSMSLTVLQVTVPLLGFLVLDRIVKEKYEKKEFMKAGYIAYALTAGFCLLCVLIPGIAGTYTGASDAGQPDILVDALISDRQALMRKDALRSLVLITVVFALILWAFRTPKVDAVGKNGSFVRKGRMSIIAVAMVVLVWLDLVSVGKRYLNKDHFVTPKDFSAHYEPRPVDEIILEDTDPDYRVLDLSVNTFNSSIPSYHHKTIGGYSPVKLQRYQDLIDRYLTSEIRSVHKVIGESATVSEVSENLPYMPVTSMLNGKYIILGGEYPPVQNPYAFGNCWFVDSVAVAATPDDEIALIGRTDLRTTAIIGDDFKWAQEAVMSDASPVMSSPSSVMSSGVDTSADRIALTGYTPKELRYTFRTTAERAAVFSEIYYPKGWKAWVEPAGTYGQVKNGHYKPTSQAREIDLFRADWMLRGALIPEGEGELIMRFEPDSYQLGKEISRASSIVLILLLLGSVALIAVPKR
ncbi:MAG: hypothetical protein IKC68_01775 [Bacteroidales bacterium]|nr:hypothetical protein [Bacteroidales bacterium]